MHERLQLSFALFFPCGSQQYYSFIHSRKYADRQGTDDRGKEEPGCHGRDLHQISPVDGFGWVGRHQIDQSQKQATDQGGNQSHRRTVIMLCI